MNELPARLDGLRPSRQLTRATAAQERTELAVFEHHLAARYLAEIDRIDSTAIADVAEAALGEEMRVLDWGLSEAGDSVTKAELVSRKVSLQSRINNARIARRFGG
ncbi:MAG TPA: hypothetical protein VLL27_13525 [Solirubrobacterales bacterium]|nr:hypothetical protein [Solirubrobacterales bacterium]